MLIKRWAIDLLRGWYGAFSSYCFKKKLYKKNPFLKIVDVDDSILLGCAKLHEQGQTTLANNKLPDLYIDDAYQRGHLKNYSSDGREGCYRYGVIEIKNSFFSLPYPIHRIKKYVIRSGMGDVLRYLCEPRFLLGYFGTFIPPRKKLDTAILLALPSYENFYHWMIETLPRIHMLDHDDKYNNIPIVLPKSRTPRFVLETLNLCGWGDRIQYLDNGSYSVKKLYIPTLYSPRNEPCREAIEWLNDNICNKSYIPGNGIDSVELQKIYISRDDAGTRGCVNAEDVDRLLIDQGFKKINMTDYSIQDQAYIFSKAKIIIGLHGAALTNIAFTEPECTFIEIFMDGWFTRSFFNLARLRKNKYGYLLCKKEGNGIRIDTDKLLALIKNITD